MNRVMLIALKDFFVVKNSNLDLSSLACQNLKGILIDLNP